MPAKKKGAAPKSTKKANKAPQPKIELPNIMPMKSPVDLNNILEVTEEHETNRYNAESIQEASAFIKKNKKTFWERGLACFKHLFKCFEKPTQFSIIVKQEQLLKTIEKLRTQNIKSKPFLPPLETDKKTLVLDIDQTLVFSSQNQLEKYDFSFVMPYKKSQLKVYSKNRFGLESFLFQMSKVYEIVIYTTNMKDYVDNVLHHIDKKKRISHVLYKQKCLNLNKIHYLKSMKALGRDPQKVVFIDHNIASGILQPKNFLQLRPYGGQKHDRQLIKLIPFLRELATKDSVISVSKNCEQYFNRQIRLKFNSLEQTKVDCEEKQNQFDLRKKSAQISMNIKKRRYMHKKASSELEHLAKNEQQNEGCEKQESRGSEKQTQESQETELSLKEKDINVM